MKISLTLIFLFISVITLGVVHHFAVEFFLYWQYPFIDIPMHILGGVVVALAWFVFLDFFSVENKRYHSYVSTVLFVLAIGVLWEMFEFYAGIPIYVGDTTLDLIDDIVGALIGIYLRRQLITL